ncbi:hypothetical protein DFH07DRAFT_771851 [Mycena maculata]|uniref:Uncharacterized protein n=1 Tax=Mycena maculata TaxID=230809 RepID=A0AAD7J9L8_9AGAR|nr:hypothetical protein DFH07DRAFT_771851 [Mycena maculata]
MHLRFVLCAETWIPSPHFHPPSVLCPIRANSATALGPRLQRVSIHSRRLPTPTQRGPPTLSSGAAASSPSHLIPSQTDANTVPNTCSRTTPGHLQTGHPTILPGSTWADVPDAPRLTYAVHAMRFLCRTFQFQQVHKLSAHLGCLCFGSSTSFNLARRHNLPIFENSLAQTGTTQSNFMVSNTSHRCQHSELRRNDWEITPEMENSPGTLIGLRVPGNYTGASKLHMPLKINSPPTASQLTAGPDEICSRRTLHELPAHYCLQHPVSCPAPDLPRPPPRGSAPPPYPHSLQVYYRPSPSTSTRELFPVTSILTFCS